MVQLASHSTFFSSSPRMARSSAAIVSAAFRREPMVVLRPACGRPPVGNPDPARGQSRAGLATGLVPTEHAVAGKQTDDSGGRPMKWCRFRAGERVSYGLV